MNSINKKANILNMINDRTLIWNFICLYLFEIVQVLCVRSNKNNQQTNKRQKKIEAAMHLSTASCSKSNIYDHYNSIKCVYIYWTTVGHFGQKKTNPTNQSIQPFIDR